MQLRVTQTSAKKFPKSATIAIQAGYFLISTFAYPGNFSLFLVFFARSAKKTRKRERTILPHAHKSASESPTNKRLCERFFAGFAENICEFGSELREPTPVHPIRSMGRCVLQYCCIYHACCSGRMAAGATAPDPEFDAAACETSGAHAAVVLTAGSCIYPLTSPTATVCPYSDRHMSRLLLRPQGRRGYRRPGTRRWGWRPRPRI